MLSRPRTETELVRRVHAGDKVAFAELIGTYENVALRLAWLLTGSAADAEEAVQNAFAKAFFAFPRFRAGAPVRPWLLRIVANEAREARRSAGRRTTLALRLADERSAGDAAPSPQAAVLAAEQRTQVLRAVQQLADRDRSVILCRYFLDLNERETAAVLGVRQGTVKSRSSRALARLRGILGETNV